MASKNKQKYEDEFNQLRWDDEMFAKQYGAKEIEAWLKDHGLY